MEAQSSRRARRKPLCDVTNSSSLSSPPVAYKSKLRPRSFAFTNPSVSADSPLVSASRSSTAGSIAAANPISGRARDSSQIGLQIGSGSVCSAGNHGSDEHSTINMVQRKDKEMDVEKETSAISAFNCPPLRKNGNTGRMKQDSGSLPSTCAVPCPKKTKRKRRMESTENKLAQDFINEHRAYFKEVDAFELCEEFVSESELEFLDAMELAYAAADLVVSRAGAMTCTEILTAGKPSILIPSPTASDDHQTKNAYAMADLAGAHVLTEDELHSCSLRTAIDTVLGDNNLMEEMCEKARRAARPNAASQIAQSILSILD